MGPLGDCRFGDGRLGGGESQTHPAESKESSRLANYASLLTSILSGLTPVQSVARRNPTKGFRGGSCWWGFVLARSRPTWSAPIAAAVGTVPGEGRRVVCILIIGIHLTRLPVDPRTRL